MDGLRVQPTDVQNFVLEAQYMDSVEILWRRGRVCYNGAQYMETNKALNRDDRPLDVRITIGTLMGGRG